MVIGTCTKWQPFQMASFETFRKELDLLTKPKTEIKRQQRNKDPFPPLGTCIERYKIESQSHYSICMRWESLKKRYKIMYKIPKVWSFSVFIHIFYPLSYIIVSFEPWV